MKLYSALAVVALGFVASAQARDPVTQTTTIFEMAHPFDGGVGATVEGGTATLTRTEDGVGLYVKTNGLPTGTYTIWAFIVNDPSLCQNVMGYPSQCDWKDITNADISTLISASGDVVPDESNGMGGYSAVSWIPVGETVGQDGAMLLPGSVRGELEDAFNAEIHFDILYHGDPLPLGDGTTPDDLYSQLRTTTGGCQYYLEAGGMEPSPSDSGGCPSMQAMFFPVVTQTTSTDGLVVKQEEAIFEMAHPFDGGIGNTVEGSTAVMTRTSSGVGLYVKTDDLPTGTYTIWMFIMNDPSLCKNEMGYPGQCDWKDVTNPEIASLISASGDVVPEQDGGKGGYSAVSWVPVGEMVGQDGAMLLPGSVRGELADPWAPEIHIDLLFHGDPLALGDGMAQDDLYSQLRTPKGGCQYYLENGGMDPAPSDSGGCPSLQSAIFQAINDGDDDSSMAATVRGYEIAALLVSLMMLVL